MKNSINLVIFSLSTSEGSLVSALKSVDQEGEQLFCLSPHLVFDHERNRICQQVGREVFFVSFYEFISQEEMEYCDQEADSRIVNEFGRRQGKMAMYFSLIKQIKNEIIFKNINKRYALNKKIILADDLGIDGEIWCRNGFVPSSAFFQERSRRRLRIVAKIQKAVGKLWTSFPVYDLKVAEKEYYFLGKIERIDQYLDKKKCLIAPVPIGEFGLLNMMIKMAAFLKEGAFCSILFVPIIRFLAALFKLRKKKKINDIIVPVHEDKDALGWIAYFLDTRKICLQDGYLPEYYPSVYLKYKMNVDNFYIWDKLSRGLFDRHALKCEVWEGFRRMTLPLISEQNRSIRQVVFLASGAGDWTALKNRSDEDLAFIAFLDAAKRLPGIRFIYRPHPLWVHAEHQGIRSIERIACYARDVGLSNFFVSEGAAREGRIFSKDQSLSLPPTTINDDIKNSDIIFGDHSQAMITAAQGKKIIASVSLARRTEFFSSYSRLGFPVLRSCEGIVDFIKKAEGDPDFLRSYNGAIHRYNEEYCGL